MLKRATYRKRGVSIENVMLGLIIVLIFGGLLYGAFTVVQRYMARNTLQQAMQMGSSEIRMLYQNRPDYYYVGLQDLYYSGALPPSMLQDEPFPAVILPFGGQMIVQAAMENGQADTSAFMFYLLWENNGRNAVSLCTSMSAGPDDGTSVSGPMGTDYAITERSCDANNPNFTVVYSGKERSGTSPL